jgi:hypothetical protein
VKLEKYLGTYFSQHTPGIVSRPAKCVFGQPRGNEAEDEIEEPRILSASEVRT